jgi:uncharacterized protein (TIGR03000 family)
MNALKRSFPTLSTFILALGTMAISSGTNKANAQGHGGGGGHFAGSFARGGYGGYGGYGRGGYGGYGYGGRGWGYGGYGWGWGGFGWGLGLGLGLGYYGGPYYGYPYYPYSGYPYGPYAYGYSAYPYAAGYAGPNPNMPPNPVSQAGGVVSSDVTLMIRTPPDATVSINGTKSTQTGTSREFVSTGLAPGRSYTFTIRAEWKTADGKMMDHERSIPVQAGERRLIDFTLPSP